MSQPIAIHSIHAFDDGLCCSWHILAMQSYVFCRANDVSPNLCPIYAGIHLLVNETTNNYVVASDHIQAVRSL